MPGQQLSALERRMLMLLEEAGEENVVSIANTISEPVNEPKRILALANALRRTLSSGLIELAKVRDANLRWLPLPDEEAVAACDKLAFEICWDARANMWTSRRQIVAVQVLLTDQGRRRSQQALEHHGWELD